MMSALYHYLKGSPEKKNQDKKTIPTTTSNGVGGATTRKNNGNVPSTDDETTALLHKPQQQQPPPPPPLAPPKTLAVPIAPGISRDLPFSTDTAPTNPTAQQFYFPASNPTIQRYYRFTSTTLTPIAALHKKPMLHPSSGPPPAGAYTGLLRRSAVIPSHGTDLTGDWVLVSVGGRSGWARKKKERNAIANPQTLALAGFTPADEFQASEAWMGNHVFLCRGKCMLGSDAPSLFFTNALLVVGLTIYYAYLIPKIVALAKLNQSQGMGPTVWLLDNPACLITVSFILTIGTFGTLWQTALTDPGILPALSSPLKPPAPPQQHYPVGGPVGYRYCSTCNIFRPPRSKHCNSCNCCVSKFDHHCPWTGNCIGERNHRIFFAFLVFISCLLVLVTAVAVRLLTSSYQFISIADKPGIGSVLQLEYKDIFHYSERTSHRLWDAMLSMPLVCLFGMFTLLCAWSLLSLLFYHAAIITIAQTTNERVRGVYRTSLHHHQGDSHAGATTDNAADEGCCRNWYTALCRPVPASRLPDFSETVVTPGGGIPMERPWVGSEPTTPNATITSGGGGGARKSSEVEQYLEQTNFAATATATAYTQQNNKRSKHGADDKV